jgi:hypothetical protein
MVPASLTARETGASFGVYTLALGSTEWLLISQQSRAASFLACEIDTSTRHANQCYLRSLPSFLRRRPRKLSSF